MKYAYDVNAAPSSFPFLGENITADSVVKYFVVCVLTIILMVPILVWVRSMSGTVISVRRRYKKSSKTSTGWLIWFKMSNKFERRNKSRVDHHQTKIIAIFISNTSLAQYRSNFYTKQHKIWTRKRKNLIENC